jgi:hypothetical protein
LALGGICQPGQDGWPRPANGAVKQVGAFYGHVEAQDSGKCDDASVQTGGNEDVQSSRTGGGRGICCIYSCMLCAVVQCSAVRGRGSQQAGKNDAREGQGEDARRVQAGSASGRCRPSAVLASSQPRSSSESYSEYSAQPRRAHRGVQAACGLRVQVLVQRDLGSHGGQARYVHDGCAEMQVACK